MNLGLILICGMLALKAAEVPVELAPGSQLRSVDVVLDCHYVEEAVGEFPGAFAGSFSSDPATLVLRGISIADDGSLDSVTNYEAPGTKTDSTFPIIFEVSASLVPVPYAESLLHADCAGEEVTCEISPYSLHLADEGPSQASWFMGTLKLSSGISIALVLKVSSDSEEDDRMAVLHPRLKVPVSKEGTVLTTGWDLLRGRHISNLSTQHGQSVHSMLPPVYFSFSLFLVEFQLSSRTPTLRTRFGTSVTLDCSFALASSSPLASLEWRLQHRGSGRRVFHYQTGDMAQAEQSTAHVDVVQLLETGDASLSLHGVGVGDEGTYICLVSTHQHQAQNIIQLQLVEPPRVRLFPELVSREGDGATTLTCEISGYYPLDVSVKWTWEAPDDKDKVPISDSSTYFSSHRQAQDGTYSINSYLSINTATELRPVTYSCHVSHLALEEPITASAQLRVPEQKTSKGLVGAFIATFIFFAALVGLLLRTRKTGKNKDTVCYTCLQADQLIQSLRNLWRLQGKRDS
ncbi:tapasin-related protein isoform X4 [Gopherus evgoodei]|uniref:tapasin-related protein isoform X4 n=1 Tax=Gopherus evgoodei TaxID=1825980 RepID=UPI0011CF19EA|nr:tapasin-related protein isoform X4 [Gopherus evgoodei]